MDGKDIVQHLRKSIDSLKEENITEVSVSSVEDYINQVEKKACECHEKHLEVYRAVISTGANAIKSAVLINGGGAIALLTFYPKAEDVLDSMSTQQLSWALLWFGIGVFISALGSGVAYFTNRAYLEKNRFGDILNIVSALMILSAYLTFMSGIYSSAKALGLFF